MRDAGAGQVLVIKLGALGDILLAEGALRDLRRHHAGARIAVLTRRPFAAMLQRCPWVDEVIVDSNAPRWRLDAMWRLRRTLRSRRFVQAHDLQDSGRSRFYLRLLGGRTARSTWPGRMSDDRVAKSIAVLPRHARQLRAAGVPVIDTQQPKADWLVAPVEDILAAAGLTSGFVVLLPGASIRGSAKRWPHYAGLAERLLARGLMPVTVPGPAELHAFDAIPGCCLRHPDGSALDLAALAGVLHRARAVVGNDSGPTHLAANLGVPGLALFGTDRQQADRTCLARASLRALVAPGFSGLDVDTVDAALAAVLEDRGGPR